MSASQPAPTAAESDRIRGLMEKGRFPEALAACEAVERAAPEDRDALYMHAVCLRYLKRVPEALALLARLEQLHPRFGRLYQERGHCYVALRDAPNAIAAFEAAVNRNPALPGSWGKLQGLYRMTGQADNAATAEAHVRITSGLAPAVLTASALFADGDVTAAEKMIRAYLLQRPQDVEGMRLLARIAMERDVVNDADFLLETVLELAPDYRAARFDYARALLRRHKYQGAVQQLEILLKDEPDNRAYRTTYATAFVGLGDHPRALTLYRELLEGAPRNPELHLSVAHTLKTLGQSAAAIESYRSAAAARPDYGDAYWSLANLKTYRFTDAELATMRAAEAEPGTALFDRYHLCFALGKALEDRGAFEESWRYYERGNALKHVETGYDIGYVEKAMRLQREVCTPAFFATKQGFGAPDPDPIFIVGLPRSGSTLLEQILASHSEVEGTMELADIAVAAIDLEGFNRNADEPRYPAVMDGMTAEQFRKIGEKYLADTRVYRTGKRFFIDKMPNNFRHIGLIHLMLPNAKIIDARREPMACCFSNLKQLFASGQEFTYSIDDIARYYRGYVALMDHWDRVLPGRVLRVQHEDVVNDLEGNVRRLLDYCGLEFEANCLEFHKTERSVRTASSEQVRRPIFREGLDQWRNFEPWLGPLRAALGDLAGG